MEVATTGEKSVVEKKIRGDSLGNFFERCPPREIRAGRGEPPLAPDGVGKKGEIEETAQTNEKRKKTLGEMGDPGHCQIFFS